MQVPHRYPDRCQGVPEYPSGKSVGLATVRTRVNSNTSHCGVRCISSSHVFYLLPLQQASGLGGLLNSVAKCPSRILKINKQDKQNKVTRFIKAIRFICMNHLAKGFLLHREAGFMSGMCFDLSLIMKRRELDLVSELLHRAHIGYQFLLL